MISKIIVRVFILLILAPSVSAEKYFSCEAGFEPACQSYGSKSCSSSAKCVASNAVCFDYNTCDFKGLVCKSGYDNLQSDYTYLDLKYSTLSEECKEVAKRSDDLVSDYNNLLNKWKSLNSERDDLEDKYQDLESCVNNAYSLDNAKSCY